MEAKNTHLRYGTVAMGLHWLIAILIIANICLGLYFADLPHADPSKFGLTQLHKSIGLTVLLLSIARVVWRLMNPVPPLPRGMSKPLRFLARATHVLLYVLIILIPLSGWALVSSSPLGLPTMYFGLFEWPHIPFLAGLAIEQKKMLRENFALVHVVLAWSAIVLIPIHVAGALFHQFLRGDDVLKRMLPGTNVTDPT
ncbi:MAG TPA: cytochrome b [Rhizomicrobium sp.]|jgi:cytochrome b561